MIQIEYLPIVLTGIGLIASILYYASVLRNANKTQQLQLETRQAQLFMYIYDRWSSQEYNKHFFAIREWEWTDYDDFMQRYGWEKEVDVYYHFSSIGSFFEGIGVMVKRGLVDPTLVDDLISNSVIFYWEKFGESIIKERRRRDNFPQLYEWVEYLYNIIKPIRDSQHPELRT